MASTNSTRGFGHSAANAYLTSRHVRHSRKRKAGESASNGGASAADDDGSAVGFVPPSSAEIHEQLRQCDSRAAMQCKALGVHAPAPVSQEMFQRWRSLLLSGNNVLLYGVGSKLQLLEQFAEEYCADAFVLELHGYLPKVSIDYVCAFIREHVLRSAVRPAKRLLQQCREIAAFGANKGSTADVNGAAPLARVFLVVHSLDGESLRSLETQTCLSILSTAAFVHVVATIDQINAPAMWQEQDVIRFRWVYFHVDTFVPYANEIKLQLSANAKGLDHSSSGITFILQSLTPSDVSTLKIIADMQLKATAANSTEKGSRKRGRASALVDYQSVYEICRKRLIHKSTQGMRNSIHCLQDHELVKVVRVAQVEKLYIPITEHLIRTAIIDHNS